MFSDARARRPLGGQRERARVRDVLGTALDRRGHLPRRRRLRAGADARASPTRADWRARRRWTSRSAPAGSITPHEDAKVKSVDQLIDDLRGCRSDEAPTSCSTSRPTGGVSSPMWTLNASGSSVAYRLDLWHGPRARRPRHGQLRSRLVIDIRRRPHRGRQGGHLLDDRRRRDAGTRGADAGARRSCGPRRAAGVPAARSARGRVARGTPGRTGLDDSGRGHHDRSRTDREGRARGRETLSRHHHPRPRVPRAAHRIGVFASPAR